MRGRWGGVGRVPVTRNTAGPPPGTPPSPVPISTSGLTVAQRMWPRSGPPTGPRAGLPALGLARPFARPARPTAAPMGPAAPPPALPAPAGTPLQVLDKYFGHKQFRLCQEVSWAWEWRAGGPVAGRWRGGAVRRAGARADQSNAPTAPGLGPTPRPRPLRRDPQDVIKSVLEGNDNLVVMVRAGARRPPPARDRFAARTPRTGARPPSTSTLPPLPRRPRVPANRCATRCPLWCSAAQQSSCRL